MSERLVRECRYCLGHGQVMLFRSWFTTDGYRREECGVCHGTGRSTYLPDAAWIRFQQQARASKESRQC